MKKFMQPGVFLICVLLLSACGEDSNSPSSGDNANVAGTWRATVQFTSCTPTSVCESAGFSGGSGNGVMILNQNRNDVSGTYTYEGAGIVGDVHGTIVGNNLTIDGKASQLLGNITVHLTGTVNQNVLPATVSHEIHLADGRSGTVFGNGEFHR